RHGRARRARLQRHHRRPRRQRDRHPPVARAQRRAAAYTLGGSFPFRRRTSEGGMKEAGYFLVVKFAIEPQAQAQVLRWLEGGHVAEVLKQPGFLWCKRLRLAEPGGFAMLYGIESQKAFLAYENNKELKAKFAAERKP